MLRIKLIGKDELYPDQILGILHFLATVYTIGELEIPIEKYVTSIGKEFEEWFMLTHNENFSAKIVGKIRIQIAVHV